MPKTKPLSELAEQERRIQKKKDINDCRGDIFDVQDRLKFLAVLFENLSSHPNEFSGDIEDLQGVGALLREEAKKLEKVTEDLEYC